MIKSNVTAIANSPETLRMLHAIGMQARPIPRQHIITLSVSADTRDRLKEAAKKTGRSVSNLIEEIAREWMQKNNC